nr:hypothetical protein [Acutalibacter muris]
MAEKEIDYAFFCCDEIEKLRVKDIDSKEMRIFVKGGEIKKVEKRACIFHSRSV